MIWSARRWASLAAGMAGASVRRTCAMVNGAAQSVHGLLLQGYERRSYGQIHATVVDLCLTVSARSSDAAPGTCMHSWAHAGWVLPLSLYSMGSLICIGFAPETVVSLNPFSGAVRWVSSIWSGAPARRKGLRIGIAIRNYNPNRGDTSVQWGVSDGEV